MVSFSLLVEILRDRRPYTKILLLGIFPRDANPDGKARLRNREINALIEELHDGEHVHYLNINREFLTEDGRLTQEVMPDFLHPKERGYSIWAKAIEDKLAELGGWDPIE